MKSLLLILPLLVAGCATVPTASTPVYRAAGTEPFWSLQIGDRTMTFSEPEKSPVVQATPKVIHGFAGEIYQSPRISVNIVHAPCSDGMSDRKYPDKVQVGVDGRHFEGCGGL